MSYYVGTYRHLMQKKEQVKGVGGAWPGIGTGGLGSHRPVHIDTTLAGTLFLCSAHGKAFNRLDIKKAGPFLTLPLMHHQIQLPITF